MIIIVACPSVNLSGTPLKLAGRPYTESSNMDKSRWTMCILWNLLVAIDTATADLGTVVGLFLILYKIRL